MLIDGRGIGKLTNLLERVHNLFHGYAELHCFSLALEVREQELAHRQIRLDFFQHLVCFTA